MNKHINHISGLIPALRRKAQDLREEAAYADSCKEGASRLARRLREEAEALDREASALEEVLAD